MNVVITLNVILLIMRNVSDEMRTVNQNTYFKFSNFFCKSCRLWNNVDKHGRAIQVVDNTKRLMRTARWITKATETRSGYVILLFRGNKS